MARRMVATSESLPARPMAARPALDAAAVQPRAVVSSRTITILLWVMALAYAAFFVALEWARFHTFLMHAEDMGNMEQAAWNTAHGLRTFNIHDLFHFNNLRIKSGADPASGTDTRLSFHVEPIWILIAIPYLFHASPLNLFVLQAAVVASGVFPAAWLARRYLALPLAQVAFPLAYLLAPPLQAATLYEFHPVTLSAALLFWAIYFADGRRYWLFALFGVLAMATKEEIGLVVAMMGLWIWWRHRDRTVGLTTAVLGVGWSLICVLVIMRHFGHGHDSPYCARFNPYVINGRTTDAAAKVTSCTGVAKIWLQHPDQVLSILIMPQKLGFLHRMFMPVGYLALLAPLTLAISLPSYAVVLFSNDVHMYSGLGHYPAEFIPILIAAAIIGTAWLARRVGPRLRIPPAALTTVACLWLLFASLANQRANGFTPLAASFAWPQSDHHTAVGQRILSEIPPDAAVSAGDWLNGHLSDRPNIYLFPDMNDAQYVAVDASRDYFPYAPVDEMNWIRQHMLADGSWGIVDADDGYILMERRTPNAAHPGMGYNPHLPTALPPSFYTFVTPPTPPHIAHPMQVDFGPALKLVGYDVQRREQVNLRQPDVVLTTYWRLTQPITAPITPVAYLTNGAGALDVRANDHPATDWLPMTQWPLNKTIVLTTIQMPIYTNENGNIDIDLAVYRPETCTYYASLKPPQTCDELGDSVHRYLPNVRWTPGHVPMEVVANGTILKLAQVPAQW